MSKIILPKPKPKSAIATQLEDSLGLDMLIKDALHIVEAELVRFRAKTKNQRSLDLKEARVLQGYLKTLVELSREQRDRAKDFDFASMEVDELLELMKVLIEKKRQTGNPSPSGSNPE